MAPANAEGATLGDAQRTPDGPPSAGDPDDPAKQPGRRSSWMTAASYGSLGLEMGISVFVGWLVGSWLDGKLGSAPWMTILFLLSGIGAAFRAVFRVGRQALHEMRRDGVEGGPEQPSGDADDGRR